VRRAHLHRAIIAAVASAMLGAAAPAAEPRLGAHGLILPGTFAGELSAPSGPGILHRLDLWPDQVFQLRRVPSGGGTQQDSLGRWFVDPDRRALFLEGTGEPPLAFMIQGDGALRLLDQAGRPIERAPPPTLARRDGFAPFAPRLSLRGMFLDVADSARFTECVSGRSWPVAMEGDFLALQRAYLATRPAPREGALPEALLATVEATVVERPRMEGAGTQPTLLVERFVALSPGEACARPPATASLRNTFWRIVTLAGEAIPPEEGRREPYLLISAAEPRFAATVGCNQMLGGVETAGDGLRFRPGPMTLMACPPPLDSRERRVASLLGEVARYRLDGTTLALLAADGRTLATFEAAYLR